MAKAMPVDHSAMDAVADGCYRGDGFITDNGAGLNNLLVEYLKTLTDVCKIGILLAGKLDQGLLRSKEMKAESHHTHPTAANRSSVDRKAMAHIGSFYSNILTSMAPLWQQTMFEDCDGGRLNEPQSSQPQGSRMERIGACLVDLHVSMTQSGGGLLDNGHKEEGRQPLVRKSSPCIVITDTDGALDRRHLAPQPLLVPDTDVYNSTKSHVPTDADMDSIINFLSSTHMSAAEPVSQLVKPAAARRLPLSNQRSSPLPGTATRTDRESAPLTSIRHHSDWQLYANAQKSLLEADRTKVHSANASSQCVTGNRFLCDPGTNLLPFHSWSTAKNKDSIWSHDSAASSGDESASNTDQLFASSSLDLAPLVNQTRRSSHDSSMSGQTLESSAAAQSSSKSSPYPAHNQQVDAWCSLKSNSSWAVQNADTSTTAGLNTIYQQYGKDNLWSLGLPHTGFWPSHGIDSSTTTPITVVSSRGNEHSLTPCNTYHP